jgi:hypothetical protein
MVQRPVRTFIALALILLFCKGDNCNSGGSNPYPCTRGCTNPCSWAICVSALPAGVLSSNVYYVEMDIATGTPTSVRDVIAGLNTYIPTQKIIVQDPNLSTVVSFLGVDCCKTSLIRNVKLTVKNDPRCGGGPGHYTYAYNLGLFDFFRDNCDGTVCLDLSNPQNFYCGVPKHSAVTVVR